MAVTLGLSEAAQAHPASYKKVPTRSIQVVEMAQQPTTRESFTAFVEEAEPRLRRAFVLLRGPDDGLDATAEALCWAWQHWDEVQEMANPVGYLYRVGSSRSRQRRVRFPLVAPVAPNSSFEPGLVPALARLSDRQRTVVVLVHGCGWTHQEVADALDLSRSSIGTHVERAMSQLRDDLGVNHGN
jgi:DNA-directed RNA polymerase specialized sigma24 family protein